MTRTVIPNTEQGHRYRVSLEFPNAAALKAWWYTQGQLLGDGDDLAMYKLDGLDAAKVPPNNQFLIKHDGDRPDGFKVRFETTTLKVTS